MKFRKRKVAICPDCIGLYELYYTMQKLDKPCKAQCCVCGEREASLYRVVGWKAENQTARAGS